MSSDPNKKSARTFQCRDILWDAFQQMAQELECSVDYLINEAMKQYARQRYTGRTGPRAEPSSPNPGNHDPAPNSPSSVPPLPGTLRPAAPLPNATAATHAAPPPPPSRARNASALPPPPPQRTGFPPPPPFGRPPGAGVSAAPGAGPAMQVQSPPSIMSSARTVPPPLPGGRNVPPPPPMPAPTRYANAALPSAPPNYAAQLSVLYGGERLPVTKDRFIIGRGRQSSDLTIKDPNVSRQHAMIEFLNGQYYMVDMGSTNGVEYNGQRISRHPIAEGDVYRICDHEVRFTYR
jgi:hypothetical protein